MTDTITTNETTFQRFRRRFWSSLFYITHNTYREIVHGIFRRPY